MNPTTPEPGVARAVEILAAALDLEGAARSAYLASVCGEDATLRAWIEGMLRADSVGHPVLDGSSDWLMSLLDDDEEDDVGRRFGAWRSVRELGRGGMGVVYLAERADDEFRQVAALKVMRAGADAEDLAARFQRERQILANLRHPHIAQLYDGGRSEEGVPFLAMEYVAGDRLDDWCDARCLSIDRRLDLFRTVCQAVQHAHQSLVIHRDLKPANILVTEDGVVKLLDFGIAKLLPDPANGPDSAPDITRTAFHAFTPQYSSPEQIRNQVVTTATDVYALGVVLYELLTGRRPFPHSDDPFEMARLTLETDPLAPSAMVAGAPPHDAADRTVEDIAANRATTPERLRRRLHGDLDAIVLKALRKDPQARYASVQLLLDDLERYLHNQPVGARPDLAWYRMRKFARRHRRGIVASLAVLVTLAGGLAAALWQRQNALRQRDIARAEASKSQRVTDFLIDIFRTADPAEARGEDLTARQILDRGADRVKRELATQPVVGATVERAIGVIYRNLGLYDAARVLLDSSLVQHRRLLGPGNPEILDDLEAQADLSFASGGQDADSLFQLVLRMRRRRSDPDDPGIAQALNGLGLMRMAGDPAGADTLFRQAIAIFRQAQGHEADLGESLNNLALLKHHTGHYPEAESLYIKSLRIKQATLGADHPETLATMSNLGWLYELDGRFDAADSILRQTLAARRRILGDRHPLVAATLSGLGEVAFARGEYEQARQYYGEALSIRKEHLPAGKSGVATNVHMLARVLAAEGRFTEAQAMYSEAINRLQEADGTTSTGLARALNDRAELFGVHGDWAAAEKEYRRAWAIYRKNLGGDHPFSAIVESNVAGALLKQDSLDAAEPLLRHALAVLRKAWSDDHPSIGPVLIDLGTLEMRRGALDDAEQTLRQALANVTRNLPLGHWRIAQARVRLGRCLNAMGKHDEAESLLTAALAVLQPLPAHHEDYREALLGLEELSNALGRTADAAHYHRLRVRPS